MEYGRLNVSRIREKVADIKEYFQVLKEYTNQGENEFLSNKEVIRSARYAFIVMIEASSNIANHLCARLLNSSPNSYAESFFLLSNNEIISTDLSSQLGKMAGFRNLLVHGYGKGG
ncbi:MAG: type VII toxin-antitoxin system HepT family RNase toxin [Bacillota bacterium]